MSDLVDSTKIESIVGATRHESLHLGRAVSDEQTVYILHSHDCLTHCEDLRDCPFSRALDEGIEPDEWTEDEPVVLELREGWRLVGEQAWNRDQPHE